MGINNFINFKSFAFHMPTQLSYARKNIITKEMKYVASEENIDVDFLRQKISEVMWS